MIWLGERRGFLSDYVTQLWVKTTGRRVDLMKEPWLEGPVGTTREIGADFFHSLASREGLLVRPGNGLIQDFSKISNRPPDGVSDFYENTSQYELEAWSEWCSFFKPFGQLLAIIFSRRLQQLNVPLSPLDASRGVSSAVLELADEQGAVHYTAWLRRLGGSGNVLYAGSYSVVTGLPQHQGPCIKVVFPLPNGNAAVIMYPHDHPDGTFSVTSAGHGFGEPGFYFTVHHDGRVWARYVRAMQETITVYESGAGEVRADHVLKFWGATFLRLHYRLRKKERGGYVSAPTS